MTLAGGTWSEVRCAAFDAGSALRATAETVPLTSAAFRTLAAPLRSPGLVPGFDAAAMDGWAVSAAGPWILGEPIVAGPVIDSRPLAPGVARPITTGAAVPLGAERVLRSESGRIADGRLVDDGPPAAPRHIRVAGEETTPGDLLFEAGVVLTPPRVAVAAVCGLDTVTVATPPRVGIAVLGDEIVSEGVPAPGTVRDVFTVQLPDVLRRLGAVADSAVRVADDLDATVAALDRPDLALVITTGGTAHSSTDHVRAALARLGAELVVDRVAMRPGQPTMIARRGSTLHLCLPGNPMAAMVALVVVGVPLIDGLLGRTVAVPSTVDLAADVSHPRGGVLVQAYRQTLAGALPQLRQSSAMLRGLADADGILLVPEGGARAGDSVPSLDLPW